MEKTINDRLYAFIKDNGFNVNSFSKRIGVNPVIIHNIVKGRRTFPSYEILNKIALSFENIDFNWLITGSARSYLLMEEPQSAYGTKSGSRLNKKIETLQQSVEQLSAELSALKAKME